MISIKKLFLRLRRYPGNPLQISEVIVTDIPPGIISDVLPETDGISKEIPYETRGDTYFAWLPEEISEISLKEFLPKCLGENQTKLLEIPPWILEEKNQVKLFTKLYKWFQEKCMNISGEVPGEKHKRFS